MQRLPESPEVCDLEIIDLLVLSCEFRILAIQVVAEVVDLTIQTINLVLVAWSYDSEVVRVVRTLELVVNTHLNLESRLVNIKLATIASTLVVVKEPIHIPG